MTDRVRKNILEGIFRKTIKDISLHTIFPGPAHASDEIHQSLQANPQRFCARLAIAFSAEKSTEFGDQANDIIESGTTLRLRFLREEIGGLYFVGIEQEPRIPVGTASAHAH